MITITTQGDIEAVLPKYRTPAPTTHRVKKGDTWPTDALLVLAPQFMTHNKWIFCEKEKQNLFTCDNENDHFQLFDYVFEPDRTTQLLVFKESAFNAVVSGVALHFATNNQQQLKSNEKIVYYRFVCQYLNKEAKRMEEVAIEQPFVFVICQGGTEESFYKSVEEKLVKDKVVTEEECRTINQEEAVKRVNEHSSDDLTMRKLDLPQDLLDEICLTMSYEPSKLPVQPNSTDSKRGKKNKKDGDTKRPKKKSKKSTDDLNEEI
jgi:hypothetical protein